MSDNLSNVVECRAVSRLSDQLKLRFWSLVSLLPKYLGGLVAVLFVISLLQNRGSLTAVLSESLSLLFCLVLGLGVAFVWGFAAVFISWITGGATKETHAVCSHEGIKAIGKDFNFEAKWPNTTWVKEGRSAYLLRFDALFIRLPKRGFTPEQEAGFRELVRRYVPAARNRLSAVGARG